MPKLTIDGRNIEVKPGVKVIAAAEQTGIMIPRFCYHPALGSAGACRMCAVKFLDGPVRGLQMSCMVEARDGMVVSTTDDDAVDFRRFIIELLMHNHPHDCPVCDEGGHCLLQDETASSGHVMRRHIGKKRTHRDQYLGELIRHEMNRCIHCYRCRRFYQDFCGYRDFGALGSAGRTYFGRYADGPLENPFSGNLIDLCPTGVLTDRPARFKGRRWDFQRSPSLCIHCSLGCAVVVSARYRELIRVEACHNPAVNGYFICDRGRFGFGFANHPDRPRHARVASEPADYEDALQTAAMRLAAISQASGSRAVGAIASSRAGMETLMALKFLASAHGWRAPSCFQDTARRDAVMTVAQRLTPDIAVSLPDIESADHVLVIAADPIAEAPMLALALRQAQRGGARITVLDPRPVSLSCEFTHIPVSPGYMEAALQLLNDAISPPPDAGVPHQDADSASSAKAAPSPENDRGTDITAQMPALAEALSRSRHPVIVCGTDIASEAVVTAAADLAVRLRADRKNAGLFCVLPGANAFGAAVAGADGASFSRLLTAIENEEVQALLIAESDPMRWSLDPLRIQNAFKKLKLLVVLDYLPSRAFDMASVAFPVLTHFETQAVFINQEGRLQQTAPVHCAGTPMSQLTAGGHPPREFRTDIPGAGIKPAWRILMELDAVLFGAGTPAPSYSELWTEIEQELGIAIDRKPDGGISGNQRLQWRLQTSGFRPDIPDTPSHATPPTGSSLELYDVESFYGTEELSTCSSILRRVESEPELIIHPADAASRGLRDGSRVTIQSGAVMLEVKLRTAANTARGVVFLPRHHSMAWRRAASAISGTCLFQTDSTGGNGELTTCLVTFN